MTTAIRYSALYSARLLTTPTCSTLAISCRYVSVGGESSSTSSSSDWKSLKISVGDRTDGAGAAGGAAGVGDGTGDAARDSTGGSGRRLSERERRELIERIIRVDHAGELGADRIYAGQLAVLSKTPVASIIKHMWEQEKEHLTTMERLIAKHRVAPTLLSPIWTIAGFALGAGTALLGKEGAMACTVAVEELIGQHYNNQLRELMEDDPEKHKELLQIISRLRDDELEHHDTGLEHDALKAPFYSALKFAIQTGCKGAIWISERI